MSGAEIKGIFNPYMVLLSIIIAYVGSYLAISLSEQYRVFRSNLLVIEQLGGDLEEEMSERSTGSDQDFTVGKKGRFLISNKAGLEFLMLVSRRKQNLILVGWLCVLL